MNIALVTSRDYPNLAADDRILAGLLQQHARVHAVVWNDDTVDWSAFDICLIRSTWDFHLVLSEFGAWLDRIETQTHCINAPELMRWNMHKGYLLKLAQRDIPIVPTVLLPRGFPVDIATLAGEKQWPKIVVKPAISASSHRTKAFGTSDCGAQAFADELLRDGDALVQPFVDDVLVGGERSYVVIGNEITHVVRRAPFNAGANGASQPAVAMHPDEAGLVYKVLGALPGAPVYARIDLVRLQSGEPAVAEVELIEPSLFFAQNPPSAARLAALLNDTKPMHRKLV